MKHPLAKLLLICALPNLAAAQDEIPLLRPEERAVVDAQSEALYATLKTKLATAAQSTVRVWSGKKRLAYGTVIGDGRQVLTKWSEVADAASSLVVDGPNREAHDAKIIGVYEEEDLAILEINGEALKPIAWSNEKPALGAFLAAPQPDGRPAAFGVVSVLERNLRETDLAFLGIGSDLQHKGPGVRVSEVQPNTGAAVAGLKEGDIVLMVKERPISGLMELKSALTGTKPGETVPLRVRTNGGEKTISVTLSKRPELPKIYNPRLEQMERMGGKISRIRDSFTQVLQSDMRPSPDQIGGPVVDLEGRVIGITVARADRTRSFIMPSAAVVKMLANTPNDPSIAKVREPEKPVMARAPKSDAPQVPKAPSPQRMREHLLEMERLMEFMREEMRSLEPER
ncbi:MAG: PDZ domain-containing protein [Verrucomicrobia bacterium]|nr:PDZ domain-containing protein [Verrucomicrobiota bacterium]